MMNDDMALVREFAASRSESAFETLVSRHINLVHSAALRHVHDPHLTEEITQAVFIILARKAGSLGRKTVLSGWLYRTAQYASADALKIQRRRQHREQEAHLQSTLENSQTESAWLELSPILDEAMARLRETDRDAVVLRYFENRSLREVGVALGLQERAAQKRIVRALEKLRAFFAERGLASTTTIIAGLISANSVQAAPPGLAAAVSGTAVKGAAVTASTIALIRGTMKTMTWIKFKFAVGACAVLLLAASAGTIALSGDKPDNKIEQDILKLEKEWSAAVVRHDPAAVAALLSDDFVGIDGRGVLTDKTAELKEAEATPADTNVPKLLKEEHSDIRVRSYGETAVMTCINTATFSMREKQSQIRYRRTTVWVKRQGLWQCVSFHGSRIL